MSDLPPKFEIPFTSTPIGGGFATPTVTFNAGSNRLIVSSSMFGRPTVPLLQERLPDAAGLLAIALFVLLIFVTRRTLRRPQTPGRVYCASCNYDCSPTQVVKHAQVSTEPGDRSRAPEQGESPSRCPECGLPGEGRLTRSLVRGRSRFRRLTFRSLPIAVLTVALGLYALSAITTSKIRLASWPFDWLASATQDTWPLSRAGTEERQFQRFTVYALNPGATTNVPLAQFDAGAISPEFCVSSNGQYAAWVEFDAFNGYALDVMVRNLSAGITRRLRLGSNADGFLKLHGFTSDDRAIFASIVSLGNLSNKPEYSVRLLLIAPESGVPLTIGTTEITATQIGPNNFELPSYLAAYTSVPEPTWAVLSLSGPSVGRLDSARGNTKTRVVIPLPTADPYSPEPLKFESDGTLSQFCQSSAFHVTLDGQTRPAIPARPSVYLDTSVTPSAFRLGKNALFTYNNWQRPPRGSALQQGIVCLPSPDNRWIACIDGPASDPSGFITSGVIKVWEVPRETPPMIDTSIP